MSRPMVAIVALSVCLFIHNPAVWGVPLGPGFTYQGQFSREGVPANGTVNLRFSLWDAPGSGQPPLGGSQIGASQLLTNVPVIDGVFTVVLNAGGEFGPTAFSGDGRWLHIEVCADPGCSSLSILSPRQPITGTPYSLRTLSAPWTGLTGVPEGFADNVDNIGDPVWVTNGDRIGTATTSLVGIGTTFPDTRFQVNDGRIRLRESATLERWDLFYDPPSQKFYLQENAAYNHLVFTKGPDQQIGIGTDTPNANAKVHVYATAVNHAAIWGESENAPSGILGIARRDGAAGVDGYNSPGGTGVSGQGETGVHGVTFVTGGVAVKGTAGFGVAALAGQFDGDVDITGNVLKSGSATKIDHPLDPSKKFLFHSSVESSERMNVYNGNIELDDRGEATVTMPDWFMGLNKDFRYQLTPIGGPGANLHVAQEIENGSFRIGGGSPGLKVSWQVSGVRQDAWAKANKNPVEQDKSKEEVGKYLNPELFGQPKEKGLNYRSEIESQKGKFPHGE